MTLNIVAVYRLGIKRADASSFPQDHPTYLLGKFYLPFPEFKKKTESLSVVGIFFSGTNLAASPSHIFFG